ncbi:two-component system, cell cycle sensor histidine kinase and response regulator CckA [Yoonia tamlensis]|uniref:histidine kinase n=1 Tax=Yoonia tamlensis TaxID=390270 RepID=A0A1I6G7C9_9RHOB|nr:ATP-binding protein [Yoonia tamlensis]SFR38106.1 two-component system, cell cycle sensor histidine kinase and response regulator CckA [Yoonia tamlensis]
MFNGQVSEILRIFGTAPHWKRALIFTVSLLFLLGSIVAEQLALRFALVVLGGGFGCIALLPVGQKARVIRQITYDPDHAFITNAENIVQYCNPMAIGRFGDCTGRDIETVFENLIADPSALLARMRATARSEYSCKEYIMTRRAHFRLRLTRFASDLLLWRLDELGGIDALKGEGLAVPLLSAGSDGVISYQNKAFRDLYGAAANSLGELFDHKPIVQATPTEMSTLTGRTRVMVSEIAGHAGRRDIVVMPAPQENPSTPSIGVGWDAIEDLPVPLLKIAPSGDVLAANREARLLLGIEGEVPQHIGELLDGPGRPIADWLREAAEGRGSQVSQFLRGRGKIHDTFVQVTLNMAATAPDPQLIAVLNDVTEIKSLEAQFVQGQKMQAIGQLAGGVAHDFNNLLTAISGHCDLLLLRHDEGDQNYGDLIQIHQNANRAASLVGQLLAFSRKQNLQPEVIDLRDTLSDLTHLLNRLVGEKVTLSLHHDPALARIKADKRQLEQVLMNLVVNARDAMHGAGEIQVETENLTLTEPMVKDRAIVPPGDYVVVKVIDHGHGIPPEKLPKIFEPFYTTKRTGEGTGLGLSTAYGIVKQTGGYIFADSAVDNGTEFSLLFPRCDPLSVPPVMHRPHAAPLSTDPADGVILLVEDEAPVRAFASRALRLRGYSVLEADCAEAALDLLSDTELRVDLFVTDVIMPGMDGPTWVRKALETRKNTRVVFVSGYSEDAFSDGQPPIPNSVFLPKPFSLIALTETVQTQLVTAAAV